MRSALNHEGGVHGFPLRDFSPQTSDIGDITCIYSPHTADFTVSTVLQVPLHVFFGLTVSTVTVAFVLKHTL